MLAGMADPQHEVYDKIIHDKLFADYLADKISDLKKHKHQPQIELTHKESLCLYILADGGNYEDIGKALGVSAETITYHIKKLTTKFGAKNRFHAIALAISNNKMPAQL